MENKNTTLVLIGIVLLGLAFLMIKNNNKSQQENYQNDQIPFTGPGYVYPMDNDRFYESVQAQNKVLSQNMKVCSNTINAYNKHGGRAGVFKDCCGKCMTSLGNQEKNTKLYYDKFRNLQDKLAKMENQLTYTEDVLREYKKRLAFTQRELTLKPTVAKCNRERDFVSNSITGLGVESQFKQGTKY